MNQEQRDKLLEKHPFVTMNVPYTIFKDEDKDTETYTIHRIMPRKDGCFVEEEEFTEEEFKEFCDTTIAAYENAVILWKLFKERKIDHVYYFDSPQKYLEQKKKDDARKEEEQKIS